MSATPLEFRAAEADAGRRLDAVVAERAGISRALAARLIGDGAVTVDGATAAKSLRIEDGMTVRADIPSARDAAPRAQDIAVPVVFEDRWLLVVSKPAGLVVHPAPGHDEGTLVNALLARADRPAGGEAHRPGIVHRLDAGTSGLMIVAKDEQVHATLVDAMAARAVSRVYLALVEGIPTSDTLTIDAPIGRDPRNRKKMGVVATGKEARTEIAVLERFADSALVEARPVTGRTHQIRVHLAAAGHPVAGDPVYGKRRKLGRELGLARPFLHAFRLVFDHPVTGEQIALEDPLPPDLTAALTQARER